MSAGFEIYKTQNVNVENDKKLVQFKHYDRNNILEIIDKIRIHTDSEYYVIMIRGKLKSIIHDDCISITNSEVIMVKPGYKVGLKSHTEETDVEFYTITVPVTKQPIEVNTIFQIDEPLNFEDQRELIREWGVRIPYKNELYDNRWLFGYGNAPILSNHMSWDSVLFDHESDARDMFKNEYYHYHSDSYEYYVCLDGKDILIVNGILVSVSKGEILIADPGVCHIRIQMEFPFDGFVFRVPLLQKGDKSICEIKKIELKENHQAEETDILFLDAGNEVVPQNRKTHYKGWIYCEKNGKYAWIPENYLELQPNNNYKLKNYYCSYELECTKGDVVEILVQESEWYLVKNEEAKIGWIPIEKTSTLIDDRSHTDLNL